MELPRFVKTLKGHEMEIFPVHDEAGMPEEIVFWCKACDPEAKEITSVNLRDMPLYEAYQLILELAITHEEIEQEGTPAS